MTLREFNFTVGPETSTPPSAGTPSAAADLINKSYGDEYYGTNTSGTRASPNNITAGGGITQNNKAMEVIFVQGSGGAVDVTANPQINAGTKLGAMLWVIGRNDTNTLQLDDGTGLSLNGNFVMGADDILGLLWDGTNWTEIFRRE